MFPKKNLILIWLIFSTVLLFCCLILFPFPWNETFKNAAIDLQFKIRGDRQLSNKIVIVFIGPEDVQSIGWPITRDYYGYMTHILKQANAKVIGFGFLFDTRGVRYPEYDESLAAFFHSAQNVCLPLTFGEMKKTKDDFSTAKNPALPIEIFKNHAAGMGFSTLPEETVIRKVPLVVKHKDSLRFSFGFELARLYLNGYANSVEVTDHNIQFSSPHGKVSFPVDQNGFLRLNHFGDPEKVSSISFVDLLQRYRTDPDAIDFSNRLVLITATSPGISPQKVTPLSSAFPAAFIHATVAENLIENNYLRETPGWVEIFVIFFFLCFFLVTWTYQIKEMLIYSWVGMIIFYWIAVFLVFGFFDFSLPFFYPTLFSLTIMGILLTTRSHQRRQEDLSQKRLLNEEIARKQKRLEETEVNLTEMQRKLESELQEKQEISAEAKQHLAESKRQVIALESQLRDLQTYQQPVHQMISFPDIIHDKKSTLVPVLNLVSKIGSDDIPVLISGETGTGKEVIARAIHQSGNRKSKPFVAVNCGALPETLLESELFGHEKGSFTGATSQRKGRFELANGGTIFLDEITETSPAFQAKLLRVLQEGTFERLGGEKTIQVNVRVIAASSKDLKEEVQSRMFREDLFYRLNGFPLSLPPLRERKEDIPLLADHFLKKHGYKSISGFSDAAMNALIDYSWPGNVRELENLVRRSAILAQSEQRRLIQHKDLPKEIVDIDKQSTLVNYQTLDEQILEMLRSLKFSYSAISQTAKALGNRDRGTITEYFRGICFENLVNTNFDREKTARIIADSEDEKVISKVKTKMDQYLQTIESALSNDTANRRSSLFKGLPQKYHPFLQQTIEHFSR